MSQITMALEYVHSMNILHRDIKPQNVFLGKHRIVKLGDFGISKSLKEGNFTSTYIGTPYYMAPEIINSKLYDSRADIWSFGCLLYEICYLNKPFSGDSYYDLEKEIVNSTPVFGPEVPAFLNEIIGRMLQKNPQDRLSIKDISKAPMLRQPKKLFMARLREHYPDYNLDIEGYNNSMEDLKELMGAMEEQVRRALAALAPAYLKRGLFDSLGPLYPYSAFEAFLKDQPEPFSEPIEKFIELRFLREVEDGHQRFLLPFLEAPAKPFYCQGSYTCHSGQNFVYRESELLEQVRDMFKNPELLKLLSQVELEKLPISARPAFLLNVWKAVKYHLRQRPSQGWRDWFWGLTPFGQGPCVLILEDRHLSLGELEQFLVGDLPPVALFTLCEVDPSEEFLAALLAPDRFLPAC